MSRNRADSYDQKVAHIRRTAAALFASNGFSRTSVAELARECGVSKALIYHYYDSKEALLFDILQAYLAGLTAALATDPSAHASQRDYLRYLIHAVLGEYRQAGYTHKLLLHDLHVLPSADQDQLRTTERTIVGQFERAITLAAKEAGHTTPPHGPRAMMLLGTMNWTYTWFREDGPLRLDEYCDLLCDSTIASLQA